MAPRIRPRFDLSAVGDYSIHSTSGSHAYSDSQLDEQSVAVLDDGREISENARQLLIQLNSHTLPTC